MQTPLSGKSGILPALPRALHLESGILGKSGLSVADDSAAFCDDFVLVFSFSRLFYKMTGRNAEC